MKIPHCNPSSNHSLTPAQQRLLAIVRLVTAVCKLLVPLILFLGALLGFPLTTDASARELDEVVMVDDHGSTAAAVADAGTIETDLECAVDEQGRPAPPCKQCEATTKKLTTATGTTSGARVDFTFRSDNGTPYVGEIEIEVHPRDGVPFVVHDDFVTVGDGRTISVELDNDSLCDFGEIDRVTYWLLTPQPQPQPQ